MKLKYLVSVLVLLGCIATSGCVDYMILKQTVKEGSAYIADEKLAKDLWGLCSASSYGAIKRKFATDPKGAMALIQLCGGLQEVDMTGANELEEVAE